MNRSGIRADMASHARTIEPKLWPRSVNRRHVESSTSLRLWRNTKCNVDGDNSIANLDWVWMEMSRP